MLFISHVTIIQVRVYYVLYLGKEMEIPKYQKAYSNLQIKWSSQTLNTHILKLILLFPVVY